VGIKPEYHAEEFTVEEKKKKPKYMPKRAPRKLFWKQNQLRIY